jgi:hypothetical protein
MNSCAFPWSETARRLLTAHCHRLRDFFSGLARGLRDRLAAAAGEAVAAVLRALLEGTEAPYRPSASPVYRDREVRSWRDEVEDAWEEEPSEVYVTEPREVPAGPPSRWRPTLAAALHTAAWWLRRPPAGLPGKFAVIASIAAGLAAVAGVTPSAALALAGSALGLIALAEAAHDGVDALYESTLP